MYWPWWQLFFASECRRDTPGHKVPNGRAETRVVRYRCGSNFLIRLVIHVHEIRGMLFIATYIFNLCISQRATVTAVWQSFHRHSQHREYLRFLPLRLVRVFRCARLPTMISAFARSLL